MLSTCSQPTAHDSPRQMEQHACQLLLFEEHAWLWSFLRDKCIMLSGLLPAPCSTLCEQASQRCVAIAHHHGFWHEQAGW